MSVRRMWFFGFSLFMVIIAVGLAGLAPAVTQAATRLALAAIGYLY